MPYCSQCGFQAKEGDTLCRNCGKPLVTVPAKKGPPVVVWVVVGAGCLFFAIAVMGIIASILIPNFIDALQKAKQKRTVADLRTLGTAVEAYRADRDELPQAESFEALVAMLQPEYLGSPTRIDGWKRPFEWQCWSGTSDPELEPGSGCNSYRLASAGRDGVFENDSLADYEQTEFQPTDYDRDLVFGDGLLIQYPAPRGSPLAR